MNPLYQLSDISVTAGGKQILGIPQLTFDSGEFVAISGPNGAGKSTLLSVLSGLRQDYRGQCLFRGRDAHSWSRKEFSKQVAVVHQGRPVSFSFSVEEIVLMGRMPHLRGWFETSEDLEVLEHALELAGAADLRGRDFRTLSGGEQQRVILASALAQQPKVLLLDEPTTFLDLQNQIHFYKLALRLSESGVLVIAVTHDLNLAAGHAGRLLLLCKGGIAADGPAEQVLTSELIRQVFLVSPEFSKDASGKIWMRYGA